MSGRTPGQVLAIGGGAVVAAVMVGIGGFKMVDVSGSTTTHNESTYTQPIRHIVVDSGAASVIIEGTPDNKVTVDRTVTELVHRARSRVDAVGDTLHLAGDCGGIPIARCTIQYKINVPSNVDISADAAVGRLSASKLDANVSLHTDSGRVAAYDIHGGLSLSTGSGQVNVDGVSGGPVQLRADSGRINAWQVSAAQVDAQTLSGSISLGFGATPTAVQAHALSGSITVAVPRNDTVYQLDAGSDSSPAVRSVRSTNAAAPRHITAHTSSGRVVVEYAD
ncbi:MAG TPA: DUF4097 family beta strand repeat-containing protein [Mycobacteriales bacterium]|jgi:hypothetical protein|nr:DUF4097 family beta strand repeat-containing protein [Mycobacteriales bacterium]